MSQVIDLCEGDSDDDNNNGSGEWPISASIPSLPFSKKRPRNKEDKNAKGSADFVVDLELADEVEVSPHIKRRGAVRRSERNENNDAAGKCAQIMKDAHVTKTDVGGEDDQVADHGESHEGIAAAAAAVSSHPMDSDSSDQRSRDDGFANEHSQRRSTSEPPPHISKLQGRYSPWEDRLRDLADYRKIHGHCNVPQLYSENTKLGHWVGTQRRNYRLHKEGKTSPVTTFRIQALESLGFKWKCSEACVTAWDDRLIELADYRKIQGHCNVPQRYSENTKLARWVKTQRSNYKSHKEGKTSPMTLSRIQALESLGFEWKLDRGHSKGTPINSSLNEDAIRVYERAVEAPEHTPQHSLTKISAVQNSAAIKSTSTSLSKSKNPTGMAKSTSISPRLSSEEEGEARLDETEFEGSPSELAVKPSFYSDRQYAKSLTPDNSAPDGDSVESNTRRDAFQVKLPWPAHQQKNTNACSALLDSGPMETGFVVAAKKPANSIISAECPLETAPSSEMLRPKSVAAEPPQQRMNVFTYAVQATPDKPASAPQDMQQTPPDELFRSDNVLNEVELELVWLGEESMYCLSCPEFQFDFIYEYASPVLKVELRKLARDDKSEAEKLKQIVRMEEWLVSRRFDFVRKNIRMMLGRGFRRHRMGTVIAELRLLRRHQSKRNFPAVVIGRS